MSNGVVYCAIGDKYLRMAEQSARSVRKFNPNVKIKVFTDVTPACNVFDIVVQVPPGTKNRYIKLTVGVDTPFDSNVYLDTDTIVLAPLDPIFEILTRFDLAVCIAQRSRLVYYNPNILKLIGVNKDLTHFAGGVYGFNKSICPWFFNKWLENYKANERHVKLDQLSFSQTIWDSSAKIYPLSSSWNVRPVWGDAVYSDIKILHSPLTTKDPSLLKYMASKRVFDNPAAGPRWVKN